MRILLIEDDLSLRQPLGERLRAQSWQVDLASDGEEGYYFALEFRPDVAIVDLGLPKLSGLELIRRLRTQKISLPILVLTARDRWQDKVTALQGGADDYLVKPFQPEELLARVQALVRRATGWAQPVMDFGEIQFSVGEQCVTVRGSPITLTAYEYRVLETLLLRAGQVVSRAELLDRLYADTEDRDSNTLEVLLGRIRRKLDPDGQLQPIQTLRGRGYRFTLLPAAN